LKKGKKTYYYMSFPGKMHIKAELWNPVADFCDIDYEPIIIITSRKLLLKGDTVQGISCYRLCWWIHEASMVFEYEIVTRLWAGRSGL
jgi:hypothetical protein